MSCDARDLINISKVNGTLKKLDREKKNYTALISSYSISPIQTTIFLLTSGVVWDNCTQENSNFLENAQIEARRIITGLRKN